MSNPTEKDYEEIAQALNDHYGGFEITANHVCNAVILENYCPDSPGWAGDIALVVHGESCFKDILYRIDNKWTWVEGMNEGEYEHNRELI
jgi:hypothetical protein|tara:strand:+ start:559 stop:828 length:270 start_codon:yes stop_codon:yes gene_type:complete